jgi:4-amino-4-deoxy-L-arabinose transferase-like glycosyltransferase
VKAARLLFGLAAFAVPAGIYIAGASVEPASWDTAELQGVPYILGITHPTGFPFYVLAGYVWSHAFAIGSVAWRMNVMSGAAIGVAGLAAYGVALEFGASLSVALAATLVFAFSPNIWSHAVRAEAQDLAVACAAVAMYAFVRRLHGGGDRWFLAAFALCGLGMAAHPNALWVLPALLAGAAVAPRRPSVRLAAASLLLVVAALALYLYLPLRSQYIVSHHLDPTAGLTGAGGGIFWNYNDPRTPRGLIRELTGSEFQTPGYFLASFNPIHIQAALWAFIEGLHVQYGTLTMLLIFGGFVAAWRRDWRATLVVTIGCTAALLFSVIYPNESDVGRYRLLASWIAVPMLGALTPQSRGGLAAALQVALVVFLATSAALSIQRQHNFFYHPPGEGGRWVISAVRPYLPPGSAVVTGWLDATSLAYGAYVDGSLPGRIVLSDDRLNVPLYRQWAKQRRVFVLVDPHNVNDLGGTRDYATLDPYHELYEVMP